MPKRDPHQDPEKKLSILKPQGKKIDFDIDDFVDQGRDMFRGDLIRFVLFGLLISVITGSLLYWTVARRLGTYFKPLYFQSLGIPANSIVHQQFNFHLVVPNIWRSAQPSEEVLTKLKRSYGLKTVINLRLVDEKENEKHWVKAQGLQYYHFPIDPRKEPDLSALGMILDLMKDKANQPLLIHCDTGKDQTGLVAALYRMEEEDWLFDQASKEMLMYGYDPHTYPDLEKALKTWSATKK